MKFRTEIEPVNPGFEINLHDGIMTVGSCFSEIIGNKLSENKLNCLSNPFGTVFNPLSIFKLLHQSLSKQPLDQDLFTENNDDYWNHFDFHSKFSADSRQNLEHELSSIYDSVFQVLSSAKVLIITLGTANVYELKSNNQVVANCHKQPQKLFNRRLLTLKEIQDDFQQFYDLLQVANNKIKIILTVSPVRHTRDGLNNNSVSKSILRTACHLIQQDNADVGYFPSYEIMMDDLRDYRFYKSDLIHPNEMAEQ
ncbi:MAG: GSCFA domain-containing protein, partial [Spirosomaceae bacterium]|nr:GSCFA domain-containing protein [Spirosomataceae bacterium]